MIRICDNTTTVEFAVSIMTATGLQDKSRTLIPENCPRSEVKQAYVVPNVRSIQQAAWEYIHVVGSGELHWVDVTSTI